MFQKVDIKYLFQDNSHICESCTFYFPFCTQSQTPNLCNLASGLQHCIVRWCFGVGCTHTECLPLCQILTDHLGHIIVKGDLWCQGVSLKMQNTVPSYKELIVFAFTCFLQHYTIPFARHNPVVYSSFLQTAATAWSVDWGDLFNYSCMLVLLIYHLLTSETLFCDSLIRYSS